MFITYICISERQIVQNYVRNRILMFTIIQVSQDNRFIQGNIFPNVNYIELNLLVDISIDPLCPINIFENPFA